MPDPLDEQIKKRVEAHLDRFLEVPLRTVLLGMILVLVIATWFQYRDLNMTGKYYFTTTPYEWTFGFGTITTITDNDPQRRIEHALEEATLNSGEKM